MATLMLFASAAIIHYLLPSAPPWLAAYRGLLPPLHRIANELFFNQDPRLYSYATHVAEGNPVAAMPSVHAGATWLIALVAWQTRRWLGPLGLFYTVSMVLALVYLGEHYLVDAVVGIALAWAAWWVAGQPRALERIRLPVKDAPVIESSTA
jgi:membrane-associated phospholipid phosphatase